MLNSASELEFSDENIVEEISQFASLEVSGGTVSTQRSSIIVPEKTGYPDSVYVLAANIFQGIRVEKSSDKILIKYGNEPLPSLPEFEDESVQRLSYELAFSTLKCE
ncbi:Hypothetical predicted protein [Marmota monax]|uniref:Uncharacterized protein n=1 Tax=Marmota monax TaxID=9995 RepID=A0A5E4B5Q7_MARMO|nr:hypothetical protein GHT09_008529 [Marmota monax]VTJ64089.1 Hypothetical predicted protein [Marmota monax]